jgi:hypothetical protein
MSALPPKADIVRQVARSALCRFCCRSPLQAYLVSDSVAVMRPVLWDPFSKELQEIEAINLFDIRYCEPIKRTQDSRLRFGVPDTG